jgi:signal peptidase I
MLDTFIIAFRARDAGLVGIVMLLHVALLGWLIVDAQRRKRSWGGWAVLVWLFGLLGIVPWLIYRRRSPVQDQVTTMGRARACLYALGIEATAPIVGAVAAITMMSLVMPSLYQVARVEGRAMSPTLNDQDRLLVNRRAYLDRAPAVGDVVMLRYPLNPAKSFLKRVIAEGGDTLRIVDGQLYRNDAAVEEPFVTPDSRSHDDWGPQQIPADHYFVMGDRRNNSSDSRHWGFVPRGHIVGKVQYRWYPTMSRVK